LKKSGRAGSSFEEKAVDEKKDETTRLQEVVKEM
jgi:hypothetical protein